MKNNFETVNKIYSSTAVINWLDAADGLDFIQSCKVKMQGLTSVKDGDNVLDVGCGVGQEVEKYANLVGRNGRVIGTDIGESIIQEAQARLKDKDLPVEFLVGSADKLEFPDNRFDLVRAERVLEYVSDTSGMISEMVRVTRPGGEVIIFDFDYRGIIVDVSLTELARTVHLLLEQSIASPDAGGSAFRQFRQTGLTDIKVEPQMFSMPYGVYKQMVDDCLKGGLKTGAITQIDYHEWWKELDEANEAGEFFAVFPGFIVKGTKPKM